MRTTSKSRETLSRLMIGSGKRRAKSERAKQEFFWANEFWILSIFRVFFSGCQVHSRVSVSTTRLLLIDHRRSENLSKWDLAPSIQSGKSQKSFFKHQSRTGRVENTSRMTSEIEEWAGKRGEGNNQDEELVVNKNKCAIGCEEWML